MNPSSNKCGTSFNVEWLFFKPTSTIKSFIADITEAPETLVSVVNNNNEMVFSIDENQYADIYSLRRIKNLVVLSEKAFAKEAKKWDFKLPIELVREIQKLGCTTIENCKDSRATGNISFEV